VAIERPTFSESWYRVAQLRPRLRSAVQASRQHFRGQMWYVLRDPVTNQFLRINETAYHFIGLLDGRRTVAEAWQISNEQLGDYAPTQGEGIQHLGQLYALNMLQAELSPDTEGLFRRYRRRRTREVQSYLTNLLFAKIPVFDPERLLERWGGVLGRVFTWYGLVAWLAILAAGGYALAGRFKELIVAGQAENVLSQDNLPYFYLAMLAIKLLHEFGHAFACKRFGLVSGTGGEVHTLGIMFLVFMPLPYVDASSASSLRSKWQRTVVGAAGMMVELAVASIAAVVWVNTPPGSVVHAICYNMIFIASVSTLLFNGNPLLRYDGYYILSDLTEIPNLAQRSKEYLYYLVKRYAWSVKGLRNPAHTGGEEAWFVFYGVASTIYRVFISVRILLYIADRFFFVGAVMAVGAAVVWVLVPLGKFLHYLATSGELMRTRQRATAMTAVVTVLVVAGVGLIPMPDRFRVEGVVEPVEMAVVYTQTDGFVESYLPSGSEVRPGGQPLLVGRNRELEASLKALEADRDRLLAHEWMLQQKDPAVAVAATRQLQANQKQIEQVRRQIDDLTLRSSLAGVWVSHDVERLAGAYLKRGQAVGLVVDSGRMVVRATAGQNAAASLYDQATHGRQPVGVEIRVRGRPDLQAKGDIEEIWPAGRQQLPSAALSLLAGGSVATVRDDREGMKAAERFFEIRVAPRGSAPLMAGQRVVVRFELSAKPLIVQWRRGLLQLVQRRFHV